MGVELSRSGLKSRLPEVPAVDCAQVGQANSQSDSAISGDVVSSGRDFIGPFQLIRMIRSGNSTIVWEARHQGENKRVALKILVSKYLKSKQHIEELKHEATVGKEMKNEHVISIFDYHDDSGPPMISMELFNARNLKIVLRERHEFIGANAKKIIKRAALGLKHMHSKGWLHCDVKPDNYLCDIDCTVKLIDFSIAEKEKKKGFSLFGGSKHIRGTRSYMSPEQIRKKQLSPVSDIYGFGCMLFEIASGRVPFTAPNSDELLNKHLKASIPSLEASSGSTKEFSGLVMRMLAKKPEDRPANMDEVVSYLDKIRIFRAGKAPKGKEQPR